MCYHFISEEDQFSCNSTWFDIVLKTHCSQKQPPEVFATVLKWDSNTGVFLWNLLSFYKHLFWITLLSCAELSLGVVSYKCSNTKNNNLKLNVFSLLKNKKIGLCKEYFEESCFNKSVDLGRRLMNSKD